MNNQNLLIYESDELYNILNELTTNSNFKVIKFTKNEILMLTTCEKMRNS